MYCTYPMGRFLCLNLEAYPILNKMCGVFFSLVVHFFMNFHVVALSRLPNISLMPLKASPSLSQKYYNVTAHNTLPLYLCSHARSVT